MLEGKRAHWRKLDNAAKIFPATSSKRDSRVFRFYCELQETVDQECLQQAVDKTVEEYPVFLSVMRKGLFWFYLEKSDLRPIVKEEKEPPCLNLYLRDRKTLLFQVNYYQRRINFEVYHALTDGTGAIQFLKELVKNYLLFRHPEEALEDVSFLPEDVTIQDLENDSFSKYYTRLKKEKGERKRLRLPCRITGTRAEYGNLNITEAVVSNHTLHQKAKEMDSTVTEFLTSVFLCAIHEEMRGKWRNRDVVLMVPVNLRKYFPSSSLLNFFGYIEPGYRFRNKEYDFGEVLKSVQEYFREELTKEQVARHMGRFMGFEKNPFLRLAPLELKNPVMQLANLIAELNVTAILSNLGIIRMPDGYETHIKRFGVFISTPKVQLSTCTFGDELVLSFGSAFKEKNIERNFLRILKEYGIESEVLKDQFPPQVPAKYPGLLFFKCFSFACIVAVVLAGMANAVFTPQYYWALFVGGGALSMWIALAIGFYKRHNLLKNGIWQLVVLSAACVLWDYYTGWHGWSLDYAFPGICLVIQISMQIISKVQKLPTEEYMIYYILAGVIGLVPGVLLAFGLVQTAYLSILCAGLNFLFLTGLMIFKGKDLFAELYKKLHF